MSKRFRVTVIPTVEHSLNEFNSPEVDSYQEATIAKDAMALLLIHMSDDNIIPDYSNMFSIEEYVDGEWIEADEWVTNLHKPLEV